MNHWLAKFRNAFRGLVAGYRGQTSFYVHTAMGLAVVLLAWLLGCVLWQWCVLLVCIALVLSLELVNSAMEFMAKGLCDEHNPDVGAALDIAAAAVLVASLFSALIGLLILGSQLALLWG